MYKGVKINYKLIYGLNLKFEDFLYKIHELLN